MTLPVFSPMLDANKHTHSRVIAGSETIDKGTFVLFTPEAMLQHFLTEYIFAEYEIRYRYDEDAKTVYILCKGQLPGPKNIKLEAHFFSCYCDGDFPESTEPPF